MNRTSSFKIAGCGQRRMGGAVSEENKTLSAGILGAVLCHIHEYDWLLKLDVYRIWSAPISNLVSNDYSYLDRFSY